MINEERRWQTKVSPPVKQVAKEDVVNSCHLLVCQQYREGKLLSLGEAPDFPFFLWSIHIHADNRDAVLFQDSGPFLQMLQLADRRWSAIRPELQEQGFASKRGELLILSSQIWQSKVRRGNRFDQPGCHRLRRSLGPKRLGRSQVSARGTTKRFRLEPRGLFLHFDPVVDRQVFQCLPYSARPPNARAHRARGLSNA